MRTCTESPMEALSRIQAGFSQNDERVIYAFAAAGIDPRDISPRQNVLTFHAWQAKGRRVARGATSIRVETWIPVGPAEDADGKPAHRRMAPKTAYLFHESQTVAEDAPKGTRPDAWENPALVKPGTYTPQ